MQTHYQRPQTTSGDLRIPIWFYTQAENSGPEPGETPKELIYQCLGQVYGSSNKDIEILKSHSVKRGVTIKIRDTRGGYLPVNSDTVVIDDYRYKNSNNGNLYWNIIDVRPDFESDQFIIIVLGVAQ
ncbi:phage head-tail adapter protein [Lactiplantibacillus plantarum]|uniref:phage head-tail adapter protein n=1 Tax=Lactiplantibacillus plantarum TaxID=1590 RepID=UPI0039658FC7